MPIGFMRSKIRQALGWLSTGGRPRRRYFHTNLSSYHRWYLHPLRRGAVVLCSVLVLVVFWDIGRSLTNFVQAKEIQAALQRVLEQDQTLVSEARQEGIDLSDAALQRLPGEVALANEMIEKRSFSWTRFLTELEQAIPPRMAINSIRLTPNSSLIHLTGSAMHLEDITALTVSLQDHPSFSDPVLGQHHDSGNETVEFDLTLQYRRQTK